MRIGQGYDVHRFIEGDHIVLGGVRIAFDKGFDAHSDGDVLIHAICDALLGAAAMGDIGQHFPDTNSEFENINSRVLLRHVVALLKEKDYRIINVDSTVIAQKPKVSPHILAMKKLLAEDMGLGLDDLNIKGTTTEGLGFAGREEGIAAHAVCLVDKN